MAASSVETDLLVYLGNVPFLEAAGHRWAFLSPDKCGWKQCPALLGRPLLPPEELKHTTYSFNVKRLTMKIQPQKEELLFEAGEGDRNILNGKSSLGIFSRQRTFMFCTTVLSAGFIVA